MNERIVRPKGSLCDACYVHWVYGILWQKFVLFDGFSVVDFGTHTVKQVRLLEPDDVRGNQIGAK